MKNMFIHLLEFYLYKTVIHKKSQNSPEKLGC